ncbi:MAG: single-stranded DNA-binding protein [Clostridiaceae bacterium]|nr:single-stranded DNA-binding protein [Clostridiaceae bacterium]
MENVLHLCGDIQAAPIVSHESHGVIFYTFPLEVERLSGTVDVLNIIAPEAMVLRMRVGERVRLFGQVRSYNNRGPVGNRLQISAWAKSLERCEDACDNRVSLTGVICKPPIYRCTPYGREITDIMLRVDRAAPPVTASAEGLREERIRTRFDYIPCVTWGSIARLCAGMEPYTRVTFTGRLQSRAYTKLVGTESQARVAYEVSVAQCTQ